jgi:hypothetical protein
MTLEQVLPRMAQRAHAHVPLAIWELPPAWLAKLMALGRLHLDVRLLIV